MDELTWKQTDYGPIPECPGCVEMMLSVFFTEAVSSVAIERNADPHALLIEALTDYHGNNHTMRQ